VIDTTCAVVTSIDIDHVGYLGPDRESIGFEKAGIMRAGRPAVISDPVPPQSVIRHAQEIGADLWRIGRDFNYTGDRQQWSWSGRSKRFNGMAYPSLRGVNQLLNAAGVLAAFEALCERLPVSAQAVRNGLAMVELPGRFQIVPGNPTLVLDVAHNPHAVSTLAQNLDQMGFYPRTHAVFGAMRDKDALRMMRAMMPLVDAWHFTDLPTSRAATAVELQQQFATLSARPRTQTTVACHPDVTSALRAALASADPADRILIFGSFFTVGGVLKVGLPRLPTQQMG
jgi:dihydrofolate synthase/folylpolyglutamate synthase